MSQPRSSRASGKARAAPSSTSSDLSDIESDAPSLAAFLPKQQPKSKASLKQFKPTAKTSSVFTPGDSATIFPDIARGGRAAMEVYRTLEIRQRILNLVDCSTLAGMLRLEKAITASVAEIIYKKVHVTLFTSMSRATPRRATYCDAVRVLDINPIPFIDNKASKLYSNDRFDPANLLPEMAVWREKFPQLHTILRDRPFSATHDDCFVVHLCGQDITVDLETPHVINIETFPKSGPRPLPPSPVYSNMTIRHTITLALHGGYRRTIVRTGPSVPNASMGDWRAWMLNPKLDRRVTSINMARTIITLTEDEAIRFISDRRAVAGALRTFSLPPIVGGVDVGLLSRMVSLLGAEIRSLYLYSPTISSEEDKHAIIDIIDNAFPSLQSLVVARTTDDVTMDKECLFPTTEVLLGLPYLRSFHFNTRAMVDHVDLAQSIYRIGSRNCAFYPGRLFDEEGSKRFNALISKLRSFEPKYARLHTITSADLDLWYTGAVTDYPFEPHNGRFQRVAWTRTSLHAGKLAETQSQFDGLVEQQRKAAESYQRLLTRTTEGLEAAQGDPRAEAEVLEREFAKVDEEHAQLLAAYQAMKSMATDMETKLRGMRRYSAKWLEHKAKK